MNRIEKMLERIGGYLLRKQTVKFLLITGAVVFLFGSVIWLMNVMFSPTFLGDYYNLGKNVVEALGLPESIG